MKSRRPNCHKCIHFHVTWDKKFPYGCKAFGMKSTLLPAVEVYTASRKQCLLFKEKKRSPR